MLGHDRSLGEKFSLIKLQMKKGAAFLNAGSLKKKFLFQPSLS